MPCIDRALVVGGGVAGLSAALSLRRAGVEVDLAERDPEWGVAGAGITITRSSLRAFQRLGVLGRLMEEGDTHPGVSVFSADGRFVSEVLSPPLPDAEVPGAGGILRPTLHRILVDAMNAEGVNARVGLSVQDLEQDAAGVSVRFTDGSDGRYGLVVGSDGLFSTIRAKVFSSSPRPAFTGQACWRLMTERHPELRQRHFYLGGRVKAGLTPVSRDEMYMFVLEHVPANPWRSPEEQPGLLAALLEGFGGVLAEVRESISSRSRIVYRPLEAHLLRHDWHAGRVVLIGDASHATTPQLASGAGMAAEDGIVLGEEIGRANSLEAAFAGFMRRRFERCRLVYENSLRIGELEVSGAPADAQAAVVSESLARLAMPI